MARLWLRCASGLVVVCCLSVPTKMVQAQSATTASATPSVAAQSKALSTLFTQIWEDRLKRSPEFASSIGDKRYDDQLTDYSTQALNAALARGRDYIEKLSEIDTAGLTDQEKLSADLMLRQLIEEQEGAKFKEWEMPVNQFYGFHTDLAQLPERLQL